jgi:hypothetical protein
MAQGCSTNPISFPPPGASDQQVASGTCIANVDVDNGVTMQGGRFRWDNNSSNELQLFDADDSGQLLWCANSANNHGGSSGPTNCLNSNGSILCLQQDGNMVIYAPNGPIQPHCVNNGDGGVAVWASDTAGDNDGGEELVVQEDVFFKNAHRLGDRAVIRNNTKVVWVSLGYAD